SVAKGRSIDAKRTLSLNVPLRPARSDCSQRTAGRVALCRLPKIQPRPHIEDAHGARQSVRQIHRRQRQHLRRDSLKSCCPKAQGEWHSEYCKDGRIQQARVSRCHENDQASADAEETDDIVQGEQNCPRVVQLAWVPEKDLEGVFPMPALLVKKPAQRLRRTEMYNGDLEHADDRYSGCPGPVAELAIFIGF